ncbi:GNAT family N-acetyltransferase [Virgibacillus doumboii]|uniref:GNAT family N-acetyltransferase n=1 Tax=Virgibacillus doumboii TaxID=2697503 RepID=UPI0013DF1A81|nr:GNAT family N-acetyltransferase [Virgibacillus doumboii]
MNTSIRMLHSNDYPHLEAMDTGIEDDYVKRVFNRLATGNNFLYGLFLDNGQMVSIGGISIYAGHYAMLGRLRSDRRFAGKGYSTMLMEYMMNEAFQMSGVQWVGANTQENNTSARRVIEKVGLSPYTMMHGAITKDTSALESGAKPWNPITDLERKKDWIDEMYIKPSSVFPYECYYTFPSSKELFQEHDLEEWSFYENDAQTRVLITKTDRKKHHYLHAVYPWSDITSQKGLWETISNDYWKFAKQTDGETYIWMDLTKEEAASLPAGHQFNLPSPWILYGINKSSWLTLKEMA